MDVSEAQEAKRLRDENGRLRKLCTMNPFSRNDVSRGGNRTRTMCQARCTALYAIPPRELLRTDGEHVLCPRCGKESAYINR